MAETDAPELADWLLSHGRTSITSQEAGELIGVPTDHVRVRLKQQVRGQRLFSPARGLWIPIPPQFRTWGVVPGEYFIDDVARHLRRDYYVGWLSAAELHGVAHQRPQVFQVAVDSPLANRDVGRVKLRFVTRVAAGSVPRIRRTTPTGQIWVATPELTALDLTDEPRLGGGVSTVATVLSELATEPGLSTDGLIEIGDSFTIAAKRRLGYLLGLVEADTDLGALREMVSGQAARKPSLLSPGGDRRGPRDEEWNLIVNTEVEPDL